MAAIHVNNKNFEEEVINSDKPVLLDFWASWCGPCQMLLPIVEELAQTQDDFKVCKINTDEAIELAQKFGVMSIPTLVVIKNGVETNRSVGVISKSEIIELVQK